MRLMFEIKSCQQPVCRIHDFYALILIFFLPGAGNNHLRIGVRDLQQRGHLTRKGVGIVNAVCHLNIELFAALDGDRIDLFLVENAGIDLIAAAEQLNGNDVF